MPVAVVVTRSWPCAGSWSTLREVSFLLGSLASHIPISTTSNAAVLSLEQLDGIGCFLAGALASVRHNGETEKLHLGFEIVARSALRQQGAPAAALPARWLQQLLLALERSGQGRTHITRRSAGLPPGVLALCHAEPQGPSKPLLATAMARLLRVASGECQQLAAQAAVDTGSTGAAEAGTPLTACAASGSDACHCDATCMLDHKNGGSKLESAPWPRVHAFNCLRALFASSALAADASAWCSEGLRACIEAFTAQDWEVCC